MSTVTTVSPLRLRMARSTWTITPSSSAKSGSKAFMRRSRPVRSGVATPALTPLVNPQQAPRDRRGAPN